eukprot:7826575-Alexandrium_andersonii.AAC.1
MGAGAETINSIFSLARHLDDVRAVDRLVETLAGVRLLIIDEVSMVGSKQLYEVSHRLEAVARRCWRQQHA